MLAMVSLWNKIIESFFRSVIFVDISRFVILFCNIEIHLNLMEDVLRPANKASTLRSRRYPQSKALMMAYIFYGLTGVENITLPQDDKKTEVFLFTTLYRTLCGQ